MELKIFVNYNNKLALGLHRLKLVFTIKNKTLSLFRAFFPSWIFFNRFAYSPQLKYRYALVNKKMGEWITVQKPERRQWTSFLLNADGNYFLACHSLLEELLNEAHDLSDNNSISLSETVPYKLICHWIRLQILEAAIATPHSFQFKISVKMGATSQNQEEDALVSLAHPYKEC